MKKLIEKLQNLLKKSPKLGKDYEYDFLSHRKNDVATIKLLKGKYKNVTYSYYKVEIADKENENGSLNMTFEYHIHDKAGLKDTDLIENAKFQKIIGDILSTILTEQVIKDNMKDLENEETGNDYIEEPDTRGRVRKKSTSVPK